MRFYGYNRKRIHHSGRFTEINVLKIAALPHRLRSEPALSLSNGARLNRNYILN